MSRKIRMCKRERDGGSEGKRKERWKGRVKVIKFLISDSLTSHG